MTEKQEEATRIIESIGNMHLKSLRMTACDGRSFSSGQKIKVELEDGTVWDAEVSEENTVIVDCTPEYMSYYEWYYGGGNEFPTAINNEYQFEEVKVLGVSNRALWRIEPCFDGISTAVTTYKVVDQNGTLQYMGDRNQCEYFLQHGC